MRFQESDDLFKTKQQYEYEDEFQKRTANAKKALLASVIKENYSVTCDILVSKYTSGEEKEIANLNLKIGKLQDRLAEIKK